MRSVQRLCSTAIWLLLLGIADLANEILVSAASSVNIEILNLEHRVERLPTLSNLTAPPKDEGLQGAELGAYDNHMTRRFPWGAVVQPTN